MTIYSFIQQKEIQETTRITRIGSQDKPNGRSSERIKHKGICNDTERRGSTKPIVGQIIESWVNCGIKVKICGIMFLYSQERQFNIVGSRQ